MAWTSGLSLASGAKTANLVEAYVFGSTDAGKNLVNGQTRTATLQGSGAYGSDSIGTYIEGFNDSSTDGLTIANSAEAACTQNDVVMVVFSRNGSVSLGVRFMEYQTSGGGAFAFNTGGSSTFEVSGGPVSYDTTVNQSVWADLTEFALLWDSGTGRFYYTGSGTTPAFTTPANNVQTAALSTLYIARQSSNTSSRNNIRIHALFRWSSNSGISQSDFQSIVDNPQQLLTVPIPTAPTGVTAGSITTTGFTAVWTDASGDETGFDVEYATSPFTSWTTASGSPVAAGVQSLAITGLSSNTDYRVRVRARGTGGNSAYVESATVKTVASVKVRPVSTVTAGPWTAVGAATQHEAIDEASPSDADYITTSSAGTSEHALAAVTDPQVSYGHTVRYRFRSATNDTYQVRLVQGTTIISTDPTPRTPGGTFTTYEWTLTPTEANSITDYSALRIRHTVV